MREYESGLHIREPSAFTTSVRELHGCWSGHGSFLAGRRKWRGDSTRIGGDIRKRNHRTMAALRDKPARRRDQRASRSRQRFRSQCDSLRERHDFRARGNELRPVAQCCDQQHHTADQCRSAVCECDSWLPRLDPHWNVGRKSRWNGKLHRNADRGACHGVLRGRNDSHVICRSTGSGGRQMVARLDQLRPELGPDCKASVTESDPGGF